MRDETSPFLFKIVERSKNVGLLGGNFNPIHFAHLFIADQIQQRLNLDEVYLMPESQPPHVDKKETISATIRLKMLELATLDHPNIGIERIEIFRGGKSFTFDTVRLLKELNPEVNYFFIIGGDMVEYLPKWHRIDELVEMVQFVAVKRPNTASESPYPLIWVDLPEMDVSSSEIREMIAQNIQPNFLLPKSVLDYIEENGLYSQE
ncbi:MAG: nicotinate-nucleotide adenylyltransferase [Streptococcaceae bacterium]|nr:nicotinate-nucleotide adenylyltransferase [Streptococcaceae bacterium]